MEAKNRLDSSLDEYEKLASKVKEKLPNIVFPSMGRFNEEKAIDIDNKKFIIVNGNEEV